jgi:MoxR-like ATPase
MLKVTIGYPSKEEELQIMRSNVNAQMRLPAPVVTPESILAARAVIGEIYMDEKIEKYILDIVFATRSPKQYNLGNLAQLISYGASPRASINLALGAKAYAFVKRRGYVIPEDVRAISLDVLRHRVAVTYEAEAEEVTSEQVVQEVLNKIEVP